MKQILFGLNAIDVVFIIFMTWGLIWGAKCGLSEMFGKIVGLLGTIFTVFYYYETIGAWLSSNSFLPERTALIVAFCFIAVVAWILLGIVLKILGKVMEVKFSDSLARFGGFVLGAGWFYLLGGFLIYAFLTFQAPFLTAEAVSKSYVAPSAVKAPVVLYQTLFKKR